VHHVSHDLVGRRVLAGLHPRQRPAKTDLLGASRAEELAPIGGHHHARVRRPVVEQLEEPQQPGPRRVPLPQPLRPDALKRLQEPAQPVPVVIDRVVDGEQISRLGEEHHHEPHHEATRGVVGVARHRRGPGLFHHRASALEQPLDRPTNVLPKLAGELGLSPAGRAHGGEQRRVGRAGRQGRGREQPTEEREPLGGDVTREPLVGEPLDPGEVVGVGEHQPPRAPVGQQPEGDPPSAEVLHHMREHPAPLVQPDARHPSSEHRQPLTQHPPRLEGGAVEKRLGVGRRELRLLAPAIPQPRHVEQHGVEQRPEGANVLAASKVGEGVAEVIERARPKRVDRGKAIERPAVEQAPRLREIGPGVVRRRGRRGVAHRASCRTLTSTATGSTCTSPWRR
jgi:hypothetical protein